MTYHSIGQFTLSPNLAVRQPTLPTSSHRLSTMRLSTPLTLSTTPRVSKSAPLQKAPPQKSGTVGDLCAAKSALEAELRANPGAVFVDPEHGETATAQEISRLLQHSDIRQVCSLNPSTRLSGDGPKTYWFVDYLLRQARAQTKVQLGPALIASGPVAKPSAPSMQPPVPRAPAPPPTPQPSAPPAPPPPPSPEAALAPEVDMPHDAAVPFVDPESSYAPQAPSTFEPLLPPEKEGFRIPWWGWALGAAAIGGGIYIIAKD